MSAHWLNQRETIAPVNLAVHYVVQSVCSLVELALLNWHQVEAFAVQSVDCYELQAEAACDLPGHQHRFGGTFHNQALKQKSGHVLQAMYLL